MAGGKETERRRWTANETAKLVELMHDNYAYLYEAFNPGKTKQHVDQRWEDIRDSINALGEGKSKLSVEQVSKNGLI